MDAHSLMAWFYWDPPREAFTVPLIDRPVFWYGILFVTGFILSYFILNPIFVRFLKENSYSSPDQNIATPKQMASFLIDRLCWFTVAGTLIGARLGAVFFYDWDIFRQNPLEILQIWHGGLASHGGVLGIMIALWLYLRYVQRWVPKLTYLRLLDFVAIPSALTAFFIRMGNFINQEIVGTPTTMPWGVIFGHPVEDKAVVPRHPVQLYEGFVYLAIFFFLWRLWKKQSPQSHPGAIVGWMFILIFSSRFILEFWKSTQESIIDSSWLQMGQLLSLPFVALGSFLLWRSQRGNRPQPSRKRNQI